MEISSMRKLFGALMVCCGLAFGTASAQAEKVSTPKVLNVGCEGAFAPFTFIDDQGKISGFDIDIIRAIGESLGYKVNINVLPFDGLIPALVTSNIDLIISGFTITEERAKKVDFSDPYYMCSLTYLVHEKDVKELDSLNKLNGKQVCVQIGTTGALYAQSHLVEATIKQFNSPPETYLELQNSGCRAVINDKPVNDYFLTKNKVDNIKSVNIDAADATREYYGIAVRKGDKKMLDLMNKGLDLVKKNGKFKEVSVSWFGYDITDTLK